MSSLRTRANAHVTRPNGAIPKLDRIRYDLVCDQGLKNPRIIMESFADQVKARCRAGNAVAPYIAGRMRPVIKPFTTWGIRIRRVRQKPGAGVQLPEHGIRVPHVLKNMGHPPLRLRS